MRSGVNVFDRWSGLEVLQVNEWIVAQHDIRSQYSVRIEEVFCAPHQVSELVAPFAPNKGSHVDSGSMLRLQRAVVFIHHHLNQLTHETVVLLTARLFAQLRNHHEMQVSVCGMPRGRTLISVFGKETEQIPSSIRKLRGWKANVFDDQVRALRARPSDDAEETITNVPRKLNRFHVANEFQGLEHLHIV